jgi:hypothetical protein
MADGILRTPRLTRRGHRRHNPGRYRDTAALDLHIRVPKNRESPSITTVFPGDKSTSGVWAGEQSRLELRFDRVQPWASTAHQTRPTLGTRVRSMAYMSFLNRSES